jgi:ADP-ribosylglycohydrolase
VPAPSVERRLHLAVEIALEAGSALEAGPLLHSVIGGNLQAAEALPVAVGLFVAAAGDPTTAMVAGASSGGDSDTVASMSGALAGALRGLGSIRADWLDQVERVNRLGLRQLAARIVACVP